MTSGVSETEPSPAWGQCPDRVTSAGYVSAHRPSPSCCHSTPLSSAAPCTLLGQRPQLLLLLQLVRGGMRTASAAAAARVTSSHSSIQCSGGTVAHIGGELYESVGVEAPILLSYTHKNEWNTHGGPPTRCQRSAMGVSLIFVGVRQQNGCFDTHTFIHFSTYAQCRQMRI